MAIITDLIICFLIAGLTYALISEGLWGAASMLSSDNVLFSAMIAFNFYEPVANLIDSTGIPWGFSDTLSMMGLFCISLMLLKMTTETIAPAMVRFPTPVYHLGRLVFGFGGAIVTIAIVILAFHAAPVHKKIFTTVRYDTKPPFNMGLDHQWLGFFQYETGAVFTSLGSGQPDPFGAYGKSGGGRVPVKVFDPRARWLLDHQDARPYGEDTDKVITAEAVTEGGGGAPDAAPAPAGGRGPRGAPPN